MRVCHLIKGLGRGGAEHLLPQIIRNRGAGFDHSVAFFLPWKDQLVGELQGLEVPCRCLGASSPLAMLMRAGAVARWLRRERASVVHCHLPLAGVVGRLAGAMARVPVVYTEHNVLERYHPWTRRANLATWRLQHQVVAVSDEVARSIRRRATPRVPLRVIRNGIDIARLRANGEGAAESDLRERLGIPPGAPVVGTVAVLRRQKRLDLWLEAADRIARTHPETRFVIVGDGPLRAELEARAGSLACAPRVVFAGLQEDVASHLRLFDVFLSSSEFEGLPLALLEAMALGRPVVATRVGGVPEVVTDSQTGLLVEPGDVPALEGAVSRLLFDGPFASALGAAGRLRVEEAYDVRRMVTELETLYAEIGNGPGDG